MARRRLVDETQLGRVAAQRDEDGVAVRRVAVLRLEAEQALVEAERARDVPDVDHGERAAHDASVRPAAACDRRRGAG
jgi:hypothetical protein